MQDGALVLRDIHQPAAPPWWPPAPGWWAVGAIVVVVAVGFALWRARRRAHRRRVAAIFDEALAAANSAPAQIAAMSELLRRAARRRNPQADKLERDEWLAFLDGGDKRQPFSNDVGALLLEGGFRRDADLQQVAMLRARARERFIEWMAK